MIDPKCELKLSPDCEGELRRHGAILLSPPDDHGKVEKWHGCVPCWRMLAVGIEL